MTSPPPITSVSPQQRIDTLDVLRGFALIGICVVNVEAFNRPVVEAGDGIAPGLAGMDWLTALVIHYFVTGKFWTLFSLLFGMGFALMFERASRAGLPFLPVYLRRIGALALFGLLHHVLLWSGDILLSYSAGALVLVIALFARGWLMLAILACLALSLAPPLQFFGALAVPLIFASLVALYLRARPGGTGFQWAMLLPGGLMLLAALILSLAEQSDGMRELTLIGAVLVVLGVLARHYSEPESARTLRAGVAIFVVSFGLLGLDGAVRYVAPGAGTLSSASATSTQGETASDHEARSLRHQERVRRSAEERKVLAKGTYTDGVAMRMRHLPERLRDDTGFAIVLVGVFLIGLWFVRSSVIIQPKAYLPLFRRVAMFGIPAGLLLGLAGGLIATGRPPGVDDQGYDFAHALLILGSLPASLGYLAAIVLMLHGPGKAATLVRLLAPYGRMALSNYLMQSVVFSLLFYGYGAGLWGMGRTGQVAVALALCACQIMVSHWWMARFHQGPLEWLWRALTYLTLPPWRRARGNAPGA